MSDKRSRRCREGSSREEGSCRETKKMVERDPKEYALKLRTDRRDQLHVGSVGRRNLKS